MIRTTLAAIGAGCCLGACAPFTANWYQIASDGPDGKSVEDVALVVANRSTNACVVHSVRLNAMDRHSEAFQWPDPKREAASEAKSPAEGQPGPASPNDDPGSGPHVLRSGEMLTVPLRRLVWTGMEAPRTAVCVLPLHIDVAASHCPGSAPEDFRIRFTPSLPTALPEGWVACGAAPRPSLSR